MSIKKGDVQTPLALSLSLRNVSIYGQKHTRGEVEVVETQTNNMEYDISFKGTVEKFPGKGGWTFVVVPKKHTDGLKKRRRAWGVYPIIACVGNTSWKTKLMTKKGGDFFIALNVRLRDKENIIVGNKISVSFQLK